MQGARYQHCNGDERTFETRQRRAGCGICTQETRDAAGPADLRWRASSATDCPGLLEAASRLRPLDASFACRQSCGTQDRRLGPGPPDRLETWVRGLPLLRCTNFWRLS